MLLQQWRPNGGPYYIQMQTSRTGERRQKAVIYKSEQWPVSKDKLVLKYYDNFKQFTDTIVLKKE